jgi:hypothetical protein
MSCVASGTVDTVVWSVHVQVVVEVVRSQSSYHLCKRFTQKRLAIIWCDSYAMSRLEKAKKWKGIEHMKTPPKRLEVAVPETILVPQQSLSKRQKISSCIPRTFYPDQSGSPHLVPGAPLCDGKLSLCRIFLQLPIKMFVLTGNHLPRLMLSLRRPSHIGSFGCTRHFRSFGSSPDESSC